MIVLLSVVVLISALGLVYARHEARLSFVGLQKLKEERDQLNIEWGKLLLEQGTWAVPVRVENIARHKLGMTVPAPAQVVIVRTGQRP